MPSSKLAGGASSNLAAPSVEAVAPGSSEQEARTRAVALVSELRARAPELLDLDGVDLGAALEQRLYLALRVGPPQREPVPDVLWRGSLALGALGASLLPWRPRSATASGLVVLVRATSHYRVLAAVGAAVRAEAGRDLTLVRTSVGLAAPSGARLPTLSSMLAPRRALPAVGFAVALRRFQHATAGLDDQSGWPVPALQGVARRELFRIALGAAALESVIDRLRPSLLVCLDEIGSWARLLPAVARRHGIPSLDLPHAEAANPAAIRGAGYDRMAVFGEHAAAVLLRAGITRDRIEVTGAPHFDVLVPRFVDRRRQRPNSPTSVRPRVLYAAQYVTGAMTSARLERITQAALAAAAAVAPADLVVRPHPVEPPGAIAALLRRLDVPRNVTVSVEDGKDLHELLDSATMLVTGWSNSVFEAGLLGVPSLLVRPDGFSPVPYVEEGLGRGADDPAEAAAMAAMLADPAERKVTLDRASAALERHLGPLDGKASQRAARLLLAMADGRPS